MDITNQEASSTTSAELADFASNLRWSDIPSTTRDAVKDILLDGIACALAGHDADDTHRLLAAAQSAGGPGTSTVLGGDPLSMFGATMVNGFLITAQMLCDIHWASLCHVMPEILPPLLAVAEARDSSGEDFLAALAVGLEVCTRVGIGLDYPAFRARGWHSPGITGPLGGGAAVGRVVGLTSVAMRNALGLAGSQSGGTFAQLGTPGLKFQQARGAVSGLLAGLLAEGGLRGAPDILGDPDGGMLTAFSNGGLPDLIVKDLGVEWELANLTLRRWPVGVHLQGVVYGLLKVLSDNKVARQDITDVAIAMGRVGYKTHSSLSWEDTFRARMSVHWTAAVVLADGQCWFEQFATPRLQDRTIADFARRHVHLSEDDELDSGDVRLTLSTRAGERVEWKKDPSLDFRGRQLSRTDIEAKLASSMGEGAGERAADISAAVQTLESRAGVRDFITSLGASSRR